jgi:hypothetical protein
MSNPLNLLNVRTMVSVIIPVYNAAPFVRKAVESAVSLKEVSEVLLIEDNSPDNSLAVCQTLAREYDKVKLLRHPDGGNHGAGASRNLGIRNAKCDFIAFLDADDYYLPNRFETSLPILQSRPEVDGVFEAGGVEFQSDDLRKSWTAAGRPLINPVLRGRFPVDLLDALCRGFSLQTNGFTVRRAIFNQTGLFDEHLAFSQDTAMWWKMALAARVFPGNLKQPVTMRLVHGANRSTQNNRGKIDAIHQEVHRTLWRWCKELKLPFKRRRLIFGKLVAGELAPALLGPKLLRPVQMVIPLARIFASNRIEWALTPGEMLYAYYHVSGLHGLARRVARLLGTRQ